MEALSIDLSQTLGTLDDDEVAVPCRRSDCKLNQYLMMGSGIKNAKGREARISRKHAVLRTAHRCLNLVEQFGGDCNYSDWYGPTTDWRSDAFASAASNIYHEIEKWAIECEGLKLRNIECFDW